MEDSSLEKLVGMKKERKPSCTLCSNHGVRSNLKGHKHHCPFLNCHCERCVKGRKKRDIMKQQVRLRRKQMKDFGNRTFCATPSEPQADISSSTFAKTEETLVKEDGSVLDETRENFPKTSGRSLMQSVSNIMHSPYSVPRRKSFNCSPYVSTPFQTVWTTCDGRIFHYNNWPEQGLSPYSVEPQASQVFSVSDNSAFVKYCNLPSRMADHSMISFKYGRPSSDEAAAVLASFGNSEHGIRNR
ncbi:doublesex- and mab-3-related transcription factor 1-like [Montipora capricornis]|uniref:doublesex- and mab-3-related transcription factor 1-like n=1 Tax=Montipora capricornis TaxID=246305 RepID=UPI0035F0FEEA